MSDDWESMMEKDAKEIEVKKVDPFQDEEFGVKRPEPVPKKEIAKKEEVLKE
jgi:hypothetical protein